MILESVCRHRSPRCCQETLYRHVMGIWPRFLLIYCRSDTRALAKRWHRPGVMRPASQLAFKLIPEVLDRVNALCRPVQFQPLHTGWICSFTQILGTTICCFSLTVSSFILCLHYKHFFSSYFSFYSSSLCLLPCLCDGPDEFHPHSVTFPWKVHLVLVHPFLFEYKLT